MEADNEKIPVFRSWRGWYTVVLTVLAIQIVLYFLLTQSY